MHDLSFLRANLPLFKERLSKRGVDPGSLLMDFHQVDDERRELITTTERLKAERNSLSAEVARAKRAGTDAEPIMSAVRLLKEQSENLERRVANAEEKLHSTLVAIPNLPADDVPAGRDERSNVEQKKVGSPREFSFAPKPHDELGAALGVLDLERAAKLSGARFAVYRGEGARLERALGQWMLDVQTREHGYTEVAVPLIVKTPALQGTGQLPKFAGDLFRVLNGLDAGEQDANIEYSKQDPYGRISKKEELHEPQPEDNWLIPTAEVPLTNLLRDEILDAAELPLSLTALTACFRSEAGSYGRDVRGLIRQHQFSKVELVKFALPDQSAEAHEQMTRDAEVILERLNLPYRRMLLCAGDMGFSAAKTYDLEVWLPGQNAYREISSVSNCEAFQARRANLRFRNARGKAEHLHTLNGSGLAVGRTWVAVVENYQQEDGSVEVPEVLRPYMGGLELIRPRTGRV